MLTVGGSDGKEVLMCSRSNDLGRGEMRDYQNLALDS
jgi:hypothetical protein